MPGTQKFEHNLLEKFDTEVKYARKLVRKAIVAHLNETIAKLTDYVESLMGLKQAG